VSSKVQVSEFRFQPVRGPQIGNPKMNFSLVVEELARRLTRIFVRDLEGKSAVFRSSC
jgi:hypothetical protein